VPVPNCLSLSVHSSRRSTALVQCCYWRLSLAVMLLGASFSTFSQQQQLATIDEARLVNDTTVGIVFHFEDYYRRLIDDMSTELDGEEPVRIVPIIGENHVQTIYDMLFLRGVDLGLVHADVLEYIDRFQGYEPTKRLITGLVELYGESVAIIANEEFDSIQDLAGEPVNFGVVGKGADITASLLFDTLDIQVRPVRLSLDEALAKVKSGEIAAHVHTLEDPVDQLVALGPDDNVRLLPVPQTDGLLSIYNEDEIVHEDFPNLLSKGESISSLSVSVMIASYNWSKRDPFRYDKLSRFVNAFVANFEQLQSDAYDPIWKTVSLEKNIPGVTRLPLMQQALDNRGRFAAELAEREVQEKQQELAEKHERLTEQLNNRINESLGGDTEIEELERLLGELESLIDQNSSTADAPID